METRMPPRTAASVLQLIKQKKIEFIDLRFMDFPGLPQHCTYPVSEIRPDSFTHGFGFDGSAVRGWEQLNETDMLLIPVPETAFVDPFFTRPTLAMLCDIRDPVTKREYSREPRSIARKAEAYLRKSRIADEARFAPELEFFIFDSVSYDQTVNQAAYRVESIEGVWGRGAAANPDGSPNLGNKIRLKEGYFPCPPVDATANIRSEIVGHLVAAGITVESHHHEVATGGQCEIDIRHDTLLRMSDTVMLYKYLVKQTAHAHGKVATFMPKPLYMDNGSGMHSHFSLWKEGKNLFAGRKYAGLSELALHAIAGILHHARSLLAFTSPTTNSYKRLVAGYEAPTKMVYSSRNRSAAIRIPVYSDDPDKKRLEFRCPDSSANPYLCFAAITMAALDGIQQKMDPGDPVDTDVATSTQEGRVFGDAPASLADALDALEKDNAYLRAGNVFTEDVITNWIRYKRENEVNALRERPHPYEFCMYFDV
jgi:glutamine synthetase